MSLVFGTTLRPESLLLAEVAARLAERLGVPLRLVHVCEDPRAPAVLGTDEEHVLGPVRATLDTEAERLRAFTKTDVQVHLAAGSVVDALVSVAELELATALLLGGDADTGRPLLGATAERAARRSAVPVLTLRDPDRLLAWVRGERPLRVLVGADLGRAAETARAFAAALKKVAPSVLEVVMVVSPSEAHERLGLSAPNHELAKEAEDALLRDLARSAPADESGATLRVLSARGSADAHLVGLADQGNFDLVVVGRRRSSLLEQLWYGSVARGVVRGSPVSVACVPPTLEASRVEFRAPRVVVAGTDFTDVGRRALAYAMGAVTEGGTLHVVHVLTSQTPSEADARRAREQAFHALSKLLLDACSERQMQLEKHVLEGPPAQQILALAERTGADLIVLGASNNSAVSRALLGSVARSVIEGSKVPVTLVPPIPP